MTLNSSTLAVGDVHEEVVVDNLTRTQLVMYAGASGDYNPLHSDEPFAVQAGFPGVFAHGMLTMGLTGKALTNWFGIGRLRNYSVRFRAQVWPGDVLTARVTVTDLRNENGEDVAEVSVTTTNQRGEVVVAGTAVGALDV